MTSFLKKSPGLHEDRKPYLGDALYKSSDSHKNVEVTQPNSYNLDNLVNDEVITKSNQVRIICERLGKLYKSVYNKDTLGFNYYEYRKTGKYVCFLSRNLLMQVTEKNFNIYGTKYANHSTLNTKFIDIDGATVLVVREKHVFKKQAGFLQTCIDTLKTPFVMLQHAESLISAAVSKKSRVILLDLISLILTLRDGYFTGTKLVSLLISVYTFHYRYCELFSIHTPDYRPQAGANITDMILGLSMLGLPTEVMNAIKNFTTLTGKRIFESELFMETAEKMFTNLILIVKWIAFPFGFYRIISEDNEKWIVDLLNKLGSAVFMHKDIKQVCDIYTRYVTNPQVLFDPSFREEIMNKYNSLKSSVDFMDYLQNGGNKYFQTTWNLFESNVVKSCQAFDTSGRDEPLCFVFEGEAGSGKSCVMNMFVNLLRESGMTTICHAVPAAEDGKDFYDDYENQEVFVMDDVGQQGKSQWRYLINYVSPVKYPLPCATASKKNTKFFNSKIILCTTNHFMDLNGFTSSDCVSEPEALYRRAHVIKVKRGVSDHFSQVFEYYKYDHIGSKRWENKFINHVAVGKPDNLDTVFSTEEGYSTQNTLNSLSWLYRIFTHVRNAEDRNRRQMVVSTDDYKRILAGAETETYFDAQSFDYIKYITDGIFTNAVRFGNSVIDYKRICEEYVGYLMGIVSSFISDATSFISQYAMEVFDKVKGPAGDFLQNIVSCGVFAKLLAFGIGTYIVYYFFGKDRVTQMPTPKFNEDNVKAFLDIKKHEFFGAQSSELACEHDQWAKSVQRYCKTLIVKHDVSGSNDEHTQCVVSGKRVLLPAHLDIGSKFVDLYSSWEHYVEKHVEIENVQLKLLRRFLIHDIAIYEIINTVPLYKLNRQVFTSTSATHSKNWYLINSTGILPVCYDINIKKNDEEVVYSTVHGNISHAKNTGFYTPFSASGACGTVLATPGAGILGFHVAGSTSLGFCAQPTSAVMDEIKQLMLEGSSAIGFELDTKIIPNFSGVRVRYEKPVEQVRVNGDTNFVPSPLHTSVCTEMASLIRDIESIPEGYTTTPVDCIDVKSPPIFNSKGTPAKTLKSLSQKTFMRQGRITDDEIAFIKEYLRTIMINFDDLSDEEVAFGGQYVPALNKDSSNGYNCLKGKDKYFDFENKIILESAHSLFDKIKRNADNDMYDYDDFLCRETFKDELRKSTKIDQPRTFRIMPLGHIWWTKKIFGELLKHFKSTRMETGISIGYNPYTDADALAKKLLACHTTGDADFGKWDGTILAAFIHTIMSVMKEFYRGTNSKVIDWLTNTIANSFVLVNDEIWATTHGLPSGTWLTLLLNCLINKCLTALVIYRYKPDPHVRDVRDVIDFVTGDDKVFGADEEMSKYFNLLNIKCVTESLGMDCTNGDKTKIDKPTQPFHKLTYVKRHFRQHPILRKYVGCLSLDTIMNTLQWVDTTTDDNHEAMLGKMRSMQIEAYLHSLALFKQLTKLFEDKYPFDAFFNENKVIRILTDDVGYDYVISMQNKNFMH